MASPSSSKPNGRGRAGSSSIDEEANFTFAPAFAPRSKRREAPFQRHQNSQPREWGRGPVGSEQHAPESGSQVTEHSEFSYAPAFASSRKKWKTETADETLPAPTFSYMRAQDTVSEAPWSTHDPATSQRNWSSRRSEASGMAASDVVSNADTNVTASHAGSPWTWSTPAMHTQSYTTADGTSIAPEVHSQFLDEHEIMKSDLLPKTTFQARNADLLGGASSSQIVSMIGDQSYSLNRKFDDRITQMDRNGDYIDGVNRGKPKKRHLEEHALRLAQRDEELKQANSIWQEWQSLTEAQQAERRAEAERNKEAMEGMLQMEEVEMNEEMPDVYGRGLDEISKAVREWRSRIARVDVGHDEGMPDIYERPLDALRDEADSFRGRSGPKHDDWQEKHDHFSAQNDFGHLGDTSTDLVHFSDDGSGSGPRAHGSGDWRVDRGRRTGRGTGSSRGRRTIRRGQSGPCQPQALHRDAAENRQPGRPPSPLFLNESLLDTKSTLSAQPPRTKPHTPLTPVQEPNPIIYRFRSHPRLLPLEQIPAPLIDLSEVEPLTDLSAPTPTPASASADLLTYQSNSASKPRVVSIALTAAVQYTSSAILSRIFGGSIQEIQFFPDVRQAVAIFVTPQDAEILVTHVKAMGETSAHEYRRLQIAADWYMGEASAAILPADADLLGMVMAKQASRTLLIGRIHRGVAKDVLLTSLMHQLGRPCKVGSQDTCPELKQKPLGMPSWMQRRRREEMEIAIHIVRAKLLRPSKRYEQEEVDSNSIEVEFASIPQAISAKARLTGGLIKGFEKKPVVFVPDSTNAMPGRKPWCGCRGCAGERGRARDYVDMSQGIGFIMSMREKRRAGAGYEPEMDLLVPDSLIYNHEDVKRPRLAEYDVHGMKAFAEAEEKKKKKRKSGEYGNAERGSGGKGNSGFKGAKRGGGWKGV